MKFKQYLIEKANKTELTYHKLISVLDYAHISKTENWYELNLGTAIKDSYYKKLNVRFVKSNKSEVKLGKHTTSGKYTIVIFTTKLPDRKELDDLLSDDENIHKNFIKCLDQYETLHHKSDDDGQTHLEKQLSYNDSATIETKYDELAAALQKKLQKFQEVSMEMEFDAEKTTNAFKRQSLKSAKEKLFKESIGSNLKEFLKNTFKMAEAEFVQALEKQAKDKIIRRLTDFYEQNF